MTKLSADLLKKVAEGREKGSLTMRFQGFRQGEPEPGVWMEVVATKVSEGWDFRVLLGSGKRFRNTCKDEEYEFTVETLHAMFSELGKEIPRA